MKQESIDTSTPVVVLSSLHHCGLAITRSLGRLGVPVYNTAPSACAPGPWSRYSRKTFRIDPAAMSEAEITWRLLSAADQIGARPILIPTTDVAAMLVSRNATALGDAYSFPRPTPSLVASLSNKQEMHHLATAAGVPTPKTCFPQSRVDALDFLDVAEFPLILKAAEDSKLRRRGRRTKAVARSQRELMELYDSMEDPEVPNLIVQEYIPGGVQGNWMFNGYFNRASECLFGLTGRKLRQFPIGTGATTLGACQACETVHATTAKFMRAIGYKGILDIGYQFDPRDGLYKVFDVNPRIGSTFRLFVSDTGMDVARALYLDLTGQAVAQGCMIPGRKWMVEDLDLAAVCGYLRRGAIGPKVWALSFRGLRETAYLAHDDPLPVLAMWYNDLRDLLRRRRPHAVPPIDPREDTGPVSARNLSVHPQ